MEKIDDVNLAALVTRASDELLTEKRNSAAGLIKIQLQRMEQLATDISKLKKELKKKEEKLGKAQIKMNKIKEGDWSLLVDKKDQSKGQDKE
jgi:hypothetical protein